MGGADGHIARLALGETVQFRPRGHSMTGKVNDGQLCMVIPIGDAVIAVGDIVLCRVKGSQYLHLVAAIQGERFQNIFAGYKLKRETRTRADVILCPVSEFIEDRDTPNTLAYEAAHDGVTLYAR